MTKQIPNHSNYTISEDGVVTHTPTGKVIPQTVNGGYACLNIYDDTGKKYLAKVHRLVAQTYVPQPANSTRLVLHIDLDRTNNHHSNLRWKVKGKADTAHLRYHTLNGKKYHATHLEALGAHQKLSIPCVRQRLDNGWQEDEIIQGYRHSESFWIDGLHFIGRSAVNAYKTMLDKDEKNKHKQDIKVQSQEQTFLIELQATRWKERKKGFTDDEYDLAVSVWEGMMSRCYDKSVGCYDNYGGRGVTVCDEWKSSANFLLWWKENYIPGWELEKDILPFVNKTAGKRYAPENCCFVPKEINTWYASLRRGVQIRRRRNGTFYATCNVWRNKERKRINLTGESKEDLLEQYYLLKNQRAELHLHKLQLDYNLIKRNNPKTPEINGHVLDFLMNYDHEEYLRTTGVIDITG